MTMFATLHVRAEARDATAKRLTAEGAGSFSALTFYSESQAGSDVAVIYPPGTPHHLVEAVAAAHNAALAAARAAAQEEAA